MHLVALLQPDGGAYESGLCEHVISFIGCTITSPEAAANAVLCRRFIVALLDCGTLQCCYIFLKQISIEPLTDLPVCCVAKAMS